MNGEAPGTGASQHISGQRRLHYVAGAFCEEIKSPLLYDMAGGMK